MPSSAVVEALPLAGSAAPPPAATRALAAEASAAPRGGDGGGGLRNAALSFVCGGVAGVLAKTVIAPLDRLKIIFQISAMPYTFKALVREARRTAAEEGLRALFRGNLAQVRAAPPVGRCL